MSDDLLTRLRPALTDRYEVLQEIGRGGMATVYLAEERHPRRRVAIKVFDPDLAPLLMRERFLREIDVVSKLAHPHIVPVFAAGEADGLLYYVMPYIEGESVRHRLQRSGPMPAAEATGIAREVASALQYAHDQGIIHRDIKPENILLAGGHAMVADFGIARAVGAAGGAHLTQTGFAMGTPAYMSPEQWAGSGQVDGRSDVFSLGAVVLEMLEGALPPDGLAQRRSSVRQLIRRSHSGGQTPTGLRPVLERALAVRPADRYPTAAEFGEALGGSGSFAAGLRGAVGGRRLAIALAAVLVVAAAFVIGSLLPKPGAAVVPERVVVSLFENRTGDASLAPLGMMAADWVTQGLSQTGLVEVVGTRSAMASAMPSRRRPRIPPQPPLPPREGGDLPPDAPFSAGPRPGSAAELGLTLAEETGAGIVVWGAYYLADARTVQFQAQITDARDGKLLRALEPVGSSVDSPLVAVETLRQRVMGALATIFDERLSSWATVAAQPPSYAAYQEYIEGMTLFMQLDQVEGIQHLYRAAEYDSSFVTPLLFAGFAHATLGQWPAADSIGRIVSRSRDHLSPFDRHLLDWMVAMTKGSYGEALAAVRRAAEISPGAEPLSLVGLTAMMANRPQETLDAFEQLDPERGLMQGFFLYWHYIAAAHHVLGNHRHALTALRRGLRQYPDNAMLAHMELQALAALGRVDELRDSLRRRAVNPQSWAHGPWVTSWGDLLQLLALDLDAHGHDAAAAELADTGVDWYRQQTEDSLVSETFRYGFARTLYQAGSLEEAEAMFQQLAAQRRDSVAYRGYLGAILARRGDREGALAISRSLVDLDRPYLFGLIPYWQARIAARLGEANEAVGLMRRAFAEGYPYDDRFHADADLQTLTGDPGYQDLIAPKG
jgi:tetratricopeptide (TPR) repeat protein/tRNA A-37 threonylcarbamoyl transferase component Bud32